MRLSLKSVFYINKIQIEHYLRRQVQLRLPVALVLLRWLSHVPLSILLLSQTDVVWVYLCVWRSPITKVKWYSEKVYFSRLGRSGGGDQECYIGTRTQWRLDIHIFNSVFDACIINCFHLINFFEKKSIIGSFCCCRNSERKRVVKKTIRFVLKLSWTHLENEQLSNSITRQYELLFFGFTCHWLEIIR